jgi:hypothetical protein
MNKPPYGDGTRIRPGDVGGITLARDSAPEAPPYWYRIFGARLRSDIWLPVPQLDQSERTTTEWVVRRAPSCQRAPFPDGPPLVELRCFAPCHAGRVAVRIYRDRGAAWFESDRAGMFHVTHDGRLVDVYAAPATDERALVLMLIGQISSFVLHQLGRVVLHASAVITTAGAAAFLGPKGQGKSTIAAGFMHRGAKLLTDDVLPIQFAPEGVYATPGLALMKLWPNSVANALELRHDLPNLLDDVDKKLLLLGDRYSFAHTSVPLRVMYQLERYDAAATGRHECTVRTISGRQAVVALLKQISGSEALNKFELGRLLPRYTRLAALVPLRVIRYPSGFEHQDAVHARILSDLEAA